MLQIYLVSSIMDWSRTSFWILVLASGYSLVVLGIQEIFSDEVCVAETFYKLCDTSEVLYIHSAVYGHKESEKCGITQSTEYPKGCSDNILHLVEGVCSGRNTCRYPESPANVPSDDMRKTIRNCTNSKTKIGLLTMNVQYSCVKVAQVAQGDKCKISEEDPNRGSRWITPNHTITGTVCGTKASPLQVLAQPGQRIQLDLLDLKTHAREDPGTTCEVYVRVTDGKSKTPICGSDVRLTTAYTSSESQLSLELITRGNDPRYMLRYQILGCPILAPPENAHVVSEDVSMSAVICDHADKRWTLRCENNRWIGSGNFTCPKKEDQLQEKDNHNVISITVGCATLVVTIVIVVTLSCVLCEKKKHKAIRKEQNINASDVLRSGSTELTPYAITSYSTQIDDSDAAQPGTSTPVNREPFTIVTASQPTDNTLKLDQSCGAMAHKVITLYKMSTKAQPMEIVARFLVSKDVQVMENCHNEQDLAAPVMKAVHSLGMKQKALKQPDDEQQMEDQYLNTTGVLQQGEIPEEYMTCV